MRSLNLYAGQTVKIKPGQSKMVPLCIDTHVMDRNSKLRERKLLDMNLCKIENEKVIINLKSEREDRLVQTLPALMSKGTVFLSAVNNTDVVWKIEKSQMMGSLDCRSLGYFHISRNSLQRIMLDKADFLTDRETVEYFNILKEDHKNVMKFAQEAALKKQQEVEAKRNTKLRERISKGKEDYKDSNMSEGDDPYPWLDEKDPRRDMTDEQCLKEYIDLSDSDITREEKRNLYKVLYKYKKAFSLRDEIGLCQSMEVELELKDESPFFIRPFPIKESDKDIVDKEMKKGCLLGILKKGMSSYSSPIMLIPRKLSGIPRIKQFCGMVNYLSMFLKDLQTKLIPIYHLTKKGVPFHWAELQQKAFEMIKKDLTEAPVLAMPNNKGHMVLVSDTSKIACGSALYQEQKGRYRLIAYFSKKLPLSAQRYSISELELTGIYANVTAFKHLLRNSNFTLYCDHSALVHIMNGKKEPPTLRLKKLIENLSDYKFDIKFLRGKDMFVSDFLSRQPDNEESCNDPIIPVAFLMKKIVLPEHTPKLMEWLHIMLDSREMLAYKTRDYKECQCERVMSMKEPFRVMTRSMAKTAKAEVPAMYPLQGDHKKLEESQIGIIEVKDKEDPGQGEIQVDNTTHQPNDEVMAEIDNIEIPDRIMRPIAQKVPDMTNLQVPPVLNEPIPMKPVKKATPMIDYDQILAPANIDITLKGQLPPFDVEKGIEAIHTTAEKLPDLESLFKKDKPLFKPGTEISLFMKHIPKQPELDKFVDYLRKRVIHDCKVPLSVKELKAEYHIDPYFKDIVKYLEKDYCRYVGKAQTVFKMQCEDYVLVNGILFKIKYEKENKGEPTLVLCVPEKYVPTVLYQYHTPLLAGHPGVIKLYDTIRQKYYFPGMFNLVREFVECCLECQSMKSKNDGPRIQYARIPLDTRTMARMSMDIKEMPESELGFRNILVCVCEFTNWMKTIPLAYQKAQTIAMAIYFKICCEYGTPKAIICDEAPAFQSVSLQEYFKALNIQPIYIYHQ